MPVIELEHVTKTFRARRGARALIGRGGLSELFRPSTRGALTALNDISVTVERGESLGIIGANGSGKSTLLKILAGVTVPTTGNVRVHGRVASLLELGAGFHPMLTGRENVYLNAGILGMRHAQVDERFEEILAFSGIADFIDNPVDTYSSGMYVRIAFAVAAFTDPDIFLIDEILSVGDEEFQRRCRKRIAQLMEMGKTIVFVSHDLGIVNTLCDRVLLLNRGAVVDRGSPKATINFYLRQVGAEKGLHTFTSGPVEVIVCDGRVSLFHDGVEVSASSGFQMQLVNLGRWHDSIDAEWEISERTETSCTARGRMPRLPLVLIWNLSIEKGELVWRIAIECEREIDIDNTQVNLFFPLGYANWAYEDESGSFPPLEPEDSQWASVIEPELLCEDAALVPAEGAALPAVTLQAGTSRPHLRGLWANSDYMTGARVFLVSGRLSGLGEAVQPGRHELVVLRIAAGAGPADLAREIGRRGKRRTIVSDAFEARFDRGCIRLMREGHEITAHMHLYTSVLIGNLWNDSQNLRWESFSREGDTLRFAGLSRRFPFRMEWTIEPCENGIDLEIWLEALESLALQEYHTTVVLKAGYTHWQTEHESGAYPDFHEDQTDWIHVNQDYSPGRFAAATGPGLPKVRLETDHAQSPHRMTIVNTGYEQQGRVLQALHAPSEGGQFRLDKGRHLYFKGKITVAPG